MRQLKTLFPDREFIMRSQGQVRFIRFSTRFQAVVASFVAILLLAWLTTMVVMSLARFNAERERSSLLGREAQVAKAESRVNQYRDNLDSVAEDLARRQSFIERMVDAHIGDLPEEAAAGETVTDSRSEAQRTIDKVSTALPEAKDLARIEARQLAFVERLTRYADRRAQRTAASIRKLGLNPNALLASIEDDPGAGRGGPFMSLATGLDGSLDQRFERLGLSLARMEALERGLAGIPQVNPARMDYITSGFGYRADPFSGRAAFHAGVDFKGPIGAPVHAAAQGRVAFAGRKQGYGNVVEIDHGNGLMTRYAHLSRITVAPGQAVSASDTIGAIGNTGRSTGPHLHFEVRHGDRAINPRPFLEKGRDVRKQTSSGE